MVFWTAFFVTLFLPVIICFSYWTFLGVFDKKNWWDSAKLLFQEIRQQPLVLVALIFLSYVITVFYVLELINKDLARKWIQKVK